MIIKDKDGNDVTDEFFRSLREKSIINEVNWRYLLSGKPTIEWIIQNTNPEYLFFRYRRIKVSMIVNYGYTVSDIEALYNHFNIDFGESVLACDRHFGDS